MRASAGVALERVGFGSTEAKPFGPVHAYVAPATVGVESAIVAPSQYGPPFDAVGVAGVALTTTVVVPAADVQPLTDLQDELREAVGKAKQLPYLDPGTDAVLEFTNLASKGGEYVVVDVET